MGQASSPTLQKPPLSLGLISQAGIVFHAHECAAFSNLHFSYRLEQIMKQETNSSPEQMRIEHCYSSAQSDFAEALCFYHREPL